MQFSYRIKRLSVIALLIVILTFAANESTKNSATPSKPLRPRTPYPLVPFDLDPNIFDMSVPEVAATTTATPAVQTIQKPVSAEAYLVANLETGETYTEYNARRVYPIASISKLITAIVATHHMQPSQKITITEQMLLPYGEAGGLKLGETYTVAELIYPLLLESSNDAAEAIALSYGYQSFIAQMNAFVRELGMTSTSFKDASGLSSGNVSNAHDLFILARYIYGNEKTLLEQSRAAAYSVGSTTEHAAHTWKTINPFPYDPHFLGGKTGRTTEAKESMLSLFRYSHEGYSYPVAVIVLRSDFRVREVDSSYLLSQFIRKIEGLFR